MFIIISISSKNLSSLTNFSKFFYKFKRNKTLNFKYHMIQSQKKKKFSFFSVLQSPHVNKKSQEQFEYRVYNKKLKIHVSQMVKFLTIWKIVKTKLFSDIRIETRFCFNNLIFNFSSLSKIKCDKFRLKFLKKRLTYLVRFKKKIWSNKTTHTSLKLLDIHGEIWLKSFYKSLNSSAGKAED